VTELKQKTGNGINSNHRENRASVNHGAPGKMRQEAENKHTKICVKIFNYDENHTHTIPRIFNKSQQRKHRKNHNEHKPHNQVGVNQQ
jgi:hypothetical protein